MKHMKKKYSFERVNEMNHATAKKQGLVPEEHEKKHGLKGKEK